MTEVAVIDMQKPGAPIHIDAAGEVTFTAGNDPAAMRAYITALKDRMLALPGEKLDMPVEHLFLSGMYTRTLFIPKGSLLVGKIHTKPCVNIVAKGDISVLTETGAMRVQAGFTLISPAGIQKVGYAHEDTVFINVFRTDVTDPDLVEADIASESFDFLSIETEAL